MMKKKINDMTHTWHQRGYFEHKFQKVARCYIYIFKMGHFDPKLQCRPSNFERYKEQWLNNHLLKPTYLVSCQSKMKNERRLWRLGYWLLLSPLVSLEPWPSITAPANQAHALLSKAFLFLFYVSLAVGLVQILLSMVLHRLPRLAFMAKMLPKIGCALVTIIFGSGSSLVLLLGAKFQ